MRSYAAMARAAGPMWAAGTNPALFAAEMKARRAVPTDAMQAMAASTCRRARSRAWSATGHFFRNQYRACSAVVMSWMSPAGDTTKERGLPQLISINVNSFARGEFRRVATLPARGEGGPGPRGRPGLQDLAACRSGKNEVRRGLASVAVAFQIERNGLAVVQLVNAGPFKRGHMDENVL